MIDLNELKKLAEAATPGPWERDTIRSDSEYGTDDDGGFGFDTYEVTDNTGQCIMDCTNNDNGCVEVGHDGHAWDEVAKHNAAFVAAANPEVILELIALASAAQDSAPAELPIKTWQERLREKFPETADRNLFAVGHLEHAMEAEIADLRAALAAATASPQPVAKVLTEVQLQAFQKLTSDAEVFLAGGVCSLSQSIANAKAILAASTPTTLTEKKE